MRERERAQTQEWEQALPNGGRTYTKWGEKSAGNGHGGDDDMVEDTPQGGVPGPSETDANATAGAAAEPNSERPKKKRKSRPKRGHQKQKNGR